MDTPDVLPFGTYRNCSLCPRMYKADRGLATGFYGCGGVLTAARAALHHQGEPYISEVLASGGSGTVFFSGCTLNCCFCQSHQIGNRHFGREMVAEELGRTFLRLQDQETYNVNLVAPTQYLPHIISALDQVRFKLTIPVVYNCGGYERVETVEALRDYVDIWLPGFKYCDNRLAWRYSQVEDYFKTAAAIIRQVIDQTGAPVYQPTSPGLLAKGIIIRHIVLSG